MRLVHKTLVKITFSYKPVQDRKYRRYGIPRTIGTNAIGRTRRFVGELLIVVSTPADDTLSTSGMAPRDQRCREHRSWMDLCHRRTRISHLWVCAHFNWPRPSVIQLSEYFTYPNELLAVVGHRGLDKRGSTVLSNIHDCRTFYQLRMYTYINRLHF